MKDKIVISEEYKTFIDSPVSPPVSFSKISYEIANNLFSGIKDWLTKGSDLKGESRTMNIM